MTEREILIDNYYKTSYRPVRTECSSSTQIMVICRGIFLHAC